MNNKTKGDMGESRAILYLKLHFYKILERNYHTRLGEIDIIAKKKDCIVFVEVKYRKNAHSGRPAEAVTPAKQQHIKNTATLYLQHHHLNDVPCRFDVIEILDNKITHYQNAF